MKKNIEWLKEEIKGYAYANYGNRMKIDISEEELDGLINQLDEPEVLSEEWLSANVVVGQYPEGMGYIVPAHKLQNLLVPKQELAVVPQEVADWYENHKDSLEKQLQGIAFNLDKYGEMPEVSGIDKWINETECPVQTLASLEFGYEVEEEQKYYLKIGNLYLAEPLGDMTSDIVRMTRDKGVAYQFTDEKSIATHLDKFEGTEAVKAEEL